MEKERYPSGHEKRFIVLLLVGALAFQSLILGIHFSYYAEDSGMNTLTEEKNVEGEPSQEVVVQQKKEPEMNNHIEIKLDQDAHKGHPKKDYKFFKNGDSDICKTESSFFKTVSLDPLNRFVPPTSTLSPFQNCSSGIDFDSVYVPGRIYSRTLQDHKYGGLTADMGWILMVARLALYEGKAMSFPNYWGHGCDDDIVPSWICFFEPISLSSCLSEETKERILIQEEASDRHEAKLAHVYNDKELYPQRNIPIAKYFDPNFAKLIGGDNDVQTMREVFSWIFKPNPKVQAAVSKAKSEILNRLGLNKTPFLAVHLRGGDKIGRNADGPLEAYAVPMEAYAMSIHCLAKFKDIPKTVFVATDDYLLLQKFKQELGDDYIVHTSASVGDEGFGVNTYRKDKNTFNNRKKYDQAVKLWIDMEIMKDGAYFVSCMQSNVARILHLMRYQPTNTTIRVPLHSTQSANCCSSDRPGKRMANCRSLCN